jgi:uncharacterized protein YjbI with pentapeptide repeats
MLSPKVLAATGVGATLIVALAVVAALLLSGHPDMIPTNAAVIGALITLGGVFTTQMVNTALEDRRAQANSHLEGLRAQETALQKYLEDIGSLLAELLASEPTDNLRTVARAHTLTVLETVKDPTLKRILVLFLYEAKLIEWPNPILELHGSNLRRVDLRGTSLKQVNLYGADLSYALLSGTTLSSTELSSTKLQGADLGNATLYDVGLRDAELSSSNLSNSSLDGVDLSGADLSETDLTATLGTSQWQLEQAIGNTSTTLPEGLTRPVAWIEPKENGTSSGKQPQLSNRSTQV